jgi:hypothetical protein
MSALDPARQKKGLGWFKKRSSRHSEKIQTAIPEALAALGPPSAG